MNWLLNKDNFAFDLASDEDFLRLIAELDKYGIGEVVDRLGEIRGQLNDTYDELASVDSPYKLLELFADDSKFPDHVEAIEAVLNELGISTSSLTDGVARISGWVGGIPKEYQKLLEPVGSFQETQALPDPGLINWELLKVEPEVAETLSNGVALKLAAAAKAAVNIEAGHQSPYENDDRHYLRFGVVGAADINAGATIPVNMGSISLGAGAEGDLHVNYLFAIDKPDDSFALAASSAIRFLANPLDLDSIWEDMRDGNLRAIRVKTMGQSFVNTKVGLAKKADIPGFGSVEAGLTVSAEIRLGGNYHFDVRYKAENLIDLDLVRIRSKTTKKGVGFSVVVNAKELAERINEELSDDLASLREDFAELEDFLSPGTLVRTELGEKVDELVDQDVPNKLLKLGLGLVSEDQVKEKLNDLVEGAISTESSQWAEDAEESADRLLTKLQQQYPILAEPEIAVPLKEQITELLGGVNEKLQTRLQGLSAAPMEKLLQRLASQGVKVNQAADRLDQATKGLKAALTEYHGKVEKILEGLEKVATSNIEFDWSAGSESTRGSSVALTASFTANTATTQKVFTELLSGNLDKVLNLYEQQPGGVDIRLQEWQRFNEYKRRDGWSLTVLDISLGAETLFSTNTVIAVDDSGIIGVLSEAEWKRRRIAYKESKEFGFIDSYKLLVARHTRRLNVSMRLSQSDENTQAGELGDFLKRLEDYQLVALGVGDTAEQLLKELISAADGAEVKTEISAQMSLTGPQLNQMILGNKKEADELSDEYFVEIAYEVLDKVGYLTQKDISIGVDALRKMRGVKVKTLNYTQKIAAYRGEQQRDRVRKDYSPGRSQKTLDALTKIANLNDKAFALKEIVFAMREIWQAEPDVGESYYKSRQQKIDDGLKEWVRVGSKYLFWLSDEVHKSTIALLLAIVLMSGMPQPSMRVKLNQSGKPVEELS